MSKVGKCVVFSEICVGVSPNYRKGNCGDMWRRSNIPASIFMFYLLRI